MFGVSALFPGLAGILSLIRNNPLCLSNCLNSDRYRRAKRAIALVFARGNGLR